MTQSNDEGDAEFNCLSCGHYFIKQIPEGQITIVMSNILANTISRELRDVAKQLEEGT